MLTPTSFVLPCERVVRVSSPKWLKSFLIFLLFLIYYYFLLGPDTHVDVRLIAQINYHTFIDNGKLMIILYKDNLLCLTAETKYQ